MEEDTTEENSDKMTPPVVIDMESSREIDVEHCLETDQIEGNFTVGEMEEDPAEENCGTVNSINEVDVSERSLGRKSVAIEEIGNGVPVVGMEFESAEAAQQFYKSYAKAVGFRTKIKSSNCVGRNKELCHLVFSCTKEGYKAMSENTKNPRPATREGCFARMRVKKIMGSGKWVITEVFADHTHRLNPSEACSQLPLKQDPPRKRKRARIYCDEESCLSQSTPLVSNQPAGLGSKGNGNFIEQQRQLALKQGNLIPVVGMEFESPEAAHSFYSNYARCSGFRTKIKSSNYYSGGSKDLYHLVFSCTREGYKRMNEKIKNPKPGAKEGCLAKMSIKKAKGSEKWVVTELITEHSHPLHPLQVSLYPSYMPISHQSNGAFFRQTMLPHQQSAAASAGVRDNTVGDLSDQQNLVALKGDVQALHAHFSRLQAKDPSFFYALDISNDGDLRNIFWANANARLSYGYFGDVITFNVMHLKNHNDMLFAPFMGVNHHGQLMSVGCGLVANESKETYVWLFKAWLQAMANRPPTSIIIDLCPSIQAALEEVLPDVRYCFCLSHILNRVPEKLGHLSRDDKFMKRFHNCIYESLRVERFQMEWEKMIKDYQLEGNEWLNMLYKDREKWVPVYFNDIFFAGKFTSQESECVNDLFSGHVHSKSTLTEFIEQYDLTLQRLREKETQADVDSLNTKFPLTTKSIFEKDAANVYTRGVFLKFQDEISGLTTCTTKLIKEDETVETYIVKEREEGDNGSIKHKEYEVKFNASGARVYCICHSFEFQGYLCRHALLVLMNSDVYHIPSHYILARWRKDAKRHIPSHYVLAHWSKDAFDPVESGHRVKRYDNLKYLTSKFAEDAAYNTQIYKIALGALDEAWKKVREAAASDGKVAELTAESIGRHSELKEQPALVMPSVDNWRSNNSFETEDSLQQMGQRPHFLLPVPVMPSVDKQHGISGLGSVDNSQPTGQKQHFTLPVPFTPSVDKQHGLSTPGTEDYSHATGQRQHFMLFPIG